MNLEFSPEQRMLRESAAAMLRDAGTLAAARAALDGGEVPDHWPLSAEAGWTELSSAGADGDGDHGLLEAMLVMEQCGSRLASPGLLGHLPAALLADDTASARLAFIPPGLVQVDHATPENVRVDGEASWVPDGVRAEAFVVCVEIDGEQAAVLVTGPQPGVTARDTSRYDLTRSLAHVRFDAADGRILDRAAVDVRRAVCLQQALLAAEAIGTASAALEMAIAYSKQRYTFGRAIGSYQGVKHRLVEMTRLIENARSLSYRAAWADQCSTLDEFEISAYAARSAADRSCFYAADQNLYVHGAIGATWEHDGHLLFRRAQLSRRLLGGTDRATREVAKLMLAGSGGFRAPEGSKELQSVAGQ